MLTQLVRQTALDLYGNQQVLMEIRRGIRRAGDTDEIVEARRADAERRLRDCKVIIAHYSRQ